MHRFLILLLLATGTAAAAADIFDDLERLHETDQHQQILDTIEAELRTTSNRSRRAKLLWRRARAQLTLADYGHWRGDLSDRQAIALLQTAEGYADEAIELDSAAADPYFWKAATMGLRGQIRGVLNSLLMASDVRDWAEEALERNPDHTEAHYLLGQLYRELPRWPISFGDRDRAVSYLRRSVELHEREYRSSVVQVRYFDLYTQLADALWRRDDRGDRDEAVELIQQVVNDLQMISDPTVRERKDLESASDLLADWR